MHKNTGSGDTAAGARADFVHLLSNTLKIGNRGVAALLGQNRWLFAPCPLSPFLQWKTVRVGRAPPPLASQAGRGAQSRASTGCVETRPPPPGAARHPPRKGEGSFAATPRPAPNSMLGRIRACAGMMVGFQLFPSPRKRRKGVKMTPKETPFAALVLVRAGFLEDCLLLGARLLLVLGLPFAVRHAVDDLARLVLG